MLRALVYRWKAYNQFDVEEALQNCDVEITIVDFPYQSMDEDPVFVKKFLEVLQQKEYDFVFSINYFSVISIACEQFKIKYVSWLCDSRLLTMHHKSIFHRCNRIYVFDRVDYAQFREMGANVFYLPLAANGRRLSSVIRGMTDEERVNYHADISFVGSMYEKKNEYDRCRENLTPYLQGYFDAALLAQKDVYGEDVLERMMTPDIICRLEQCVGFKKASDSFSSLSLAFMVTHLGFKLANIERMELIGLLAQGRDFKLYSDISEDKIPGARHLGKVDYWQEMPKVFHESRINLNITMRNIRTGLPLRVFDIMGCGGFLLSNFQAEFGSFFENGKDMVYYESFDDAKRKIDYYLAHEEERAEIAANGQAKVMRYHTFEHRIKTILENLKNETAG